VGRRFLVDFHRSFLLAGEPLVALRQTQVAFLSSGDPVLAHPSSWAGFVGLGGLDRRHAFR
jgi:CHAT domain-containing protein